jgi:hypothetical protein
MDFSYPLFRLFREKILLKNGGYSNAGLLAKSIIQKNTGAPCSLKRTIYIFLSFGICRDGANREHSRYDRACLDFIGKL